MSEQKIVRIEHEPDWTDTEGLAPSLGRLPEHLSGIEYVIDEVIYGIDDLDVYEESDGRARFGEDDNSARMTDEEQEHFTAAYRAYETAGHMYREELVRAADAYRAACQEALGRLESAAETYRPVQEELRSRSRELAGLALRHQKSAEQFLELCRTGQELALDKVHGPRILVVHTPPSFARSASTVNRTCTVHLKTCIHNPDHRQKGIRARDLDDKFAELAFTLPGTGLNIKYCGHCKPMTVIKEWTGR